MTGEAPTNQQGTTLQGTPEDDLTALGRCGLHAKTRAAIEEMAFKGATLHSAAAKHKMRPDNLAKAFRKPHVKAAYEQTVKAIERGAARHSFRRIVDMAENSESGRLRYDANRWVAGVGGISPVQKVDARHQHNVTFGGFTYDRPDPKDITPEDTESPDE